MSFIRVSTQVIWFGGLFGASPAIFPPFRQVWTLGFLRSSLRYFLSVFPFDFQIWNSTLCQIYWIPDLRLFELVCFMVANWFLCYLILRLLFVQTHPLSSLSHVRRTLQCSELRLHMKRVSCFQFVVCLQIHPLAGNIINSKLFLMHSASLPVASCITQISRSLYRQRVGVFVNKSLTSSN